MCTNKTRDDGEMVLSQVCSYFKMQKPNLTESLFDDRLKELCVIKIFEAIGVKNMYNRENRFFRFLSTCMAQAVSDILNLKLNIAPANVRFVRYDGINFVNQIAEYLQQDDIQLAVIDSFNLVDDNKQIVDGIEL